MVVRSQHVKLVYVVSIMSGNVFMAVFMLIFKTSKVASLALLLTAANSLVVASARSKQMAEYIIHAQNSDQKEVTIKTSNRLRALFHAEIFQAKSIFSRVKIEFDNRFYEPEQWEQLP